MPFYWTIDSKERLFTGVAEGEVTFDDAVALLEVVVGVNALSYRKLLDLRAARSAMTGEELVALCAKIRLCLEQGRVGALAVVAALEQAAICVRLLEAFVAADCLMRVFESLGEACTWLNRHALKAFASPKRS